MKSKEILFLTLVFLVFLLPIIMADGGYFSNRDLHLYEPDQKAVISLNGKNETMILSSSVKSDDIANFAWIIPIQSSSKPIVTASNISIFENLVDYFDPEAKNRGKTTSSGGVEIIESKEIDIYDITILKATSPDDLINWLNENGYKIPKESRPVVEKYVNKGNFYFVANKIDLMNKHKDALNYMNDFRYGNYVADLSIYEVADVISNYQNFINYSYEYEGHRYYFPYHNRTCFNDITGYIISNLSYDEVAYTSTWRNFIFISEDEYNNLKEKYAIPFDKIFLDEYDLGGIMTLVDLINYESFSIYCYNGASEISYLYGNESAKYREEFVNCENIIDTFGSIDIARSYFNNIPWSQIKNNYNLTILEVKNIIENELGKIPDVIKPKLRLLVKDVNSLSNGVGTPLKFEFQPNLPFYPLKISSLNEGYTNIEIYVIANKPVKDKNKVLVVDKNIEISSDLRKKLEKQIDLKKASYITRLKFKGNSSNLTDDAIFSTDITSVITPEEPQKPNIFIRIYQRITNLFRTLLEKW